MLKPIATQSGFTMMELMIVISILAITAFLAVPSIDSSYTRSELNAAQQNIAQSLRKAKQFARSVNTSSVSVSSGDDTYSFNSLGVVDNVGVITLTSTRDANETKSVTILNLLGQLQVD